MRLRVVLRSGLLALALAAAGCRSPMVSSREPANLYPHKLELRAYVDSGQYDRDLAAVAGAAEAWIKRRAAQAVAGERLTVVLDLDETLLRNWPHIEAQDFGYVPAVWNAWVDDANAPAIEPVAAVYRSARAAGIDVVFITGRPERHRAATLRNLERIGCADFAALICRPPEATGTSAQAKTEARRRLVAEGRTVIANIGDQESDLAGGFSERVFKLPNPFYYSE